MSITLDDIKKLREATGAGMSDCKTALESSKGDYDKAIEYLRKKGAATSAKRAGREAKEGFVAVYSHGGRIASMVEVNSETDFVARNSDFQAFAADIAMQIAASSPEYVSREDVPEDVLAQEKKIELEKAKEDGKPTDIAEKIVSGKLEKFYERVCLLEQPYIKNPDITIGDLLNEKVASIGEKIQIRRFERFEVGR